MLSRIILEGADRAERPPALARIAQEFPTVGVEIVPPGAGASAEAHIDAEVWDAPDLDFWAFDARMNALAARGPFAVCVTGESPAQLGRVALELLTRCQRLAPRRNAASRGPAFDEVLARHRALHDLDKPLVRADFDHTLDTWQWALRLDPDASLAVQIAALFHDVERLASEADARVEHRAVDYQAFKDAHAAEGARMAARALAHPSAPLPAPAPAPAEELGRALELIAGHERPGGDPDLDLLNDADALSFFSLNSGGFMNYFGADHTRRKIAYTLGRLRPDARPRLLEMRHPASVAPLLSEALRALAAMEGEPRDHRAADDGDDGGDDGDGGAARQRAARERGAAALAEGGAR